MYHKSNRHWDDASYKYLIDHTTVVNDWENNLHFLGFLSNQLEKFTLPLSHTIKPLLNIVSGKTSSSCLPSQHHPHPGRLEKFLEADYPTEHTYKWTRITKKWLLPILVFQNYSSNLHIHLKEKCKKNIIQLKCLVFFFEN